MEDFENLLVNGEVNNEAAEKMFEMLSNKIYVDKNSDSMFEDTESWDAFLAMFELASVMILPAIEASKNLTAEELAANPDLERQWAAIQNLAIGLEHFRKGFELIREMEEKEDEDS